MITIKTRFFVAEIFSLKKAKFEDKSENNQDNDDKNVNFIYLKHTEQTSSIMVSGWTIEPAGMMVNNLN